MSEGSDFRVTLLGTGVPIPSPDRFGPSTLIEAGQQKLLIDTGRGVAIRLFQLGIPIGKVNPVFLTHFHSDHTSGFPDLWLTGWLESWFGTRRSPLRVIGPIGTINLTSNIERAYVADIKIRIEDEKLPAEGIAITAEEFAADGVVYESGGVRVIAFEVDHGDAIKPAYGYRIEYGGYCVVISGDTRYNENVVKHGIGADLLIHEVAAARPALLAEPYMQRIIGHHTTPREAGMVFLRTGPRLAAYTHLVLPGSDKVLPATVADVIAETRTTYPGPLEIGEDLMSFEIGTMITVRRGKSVRVY
ncbi:MAG: MBL fold metallo-hydrolase [Xanthobacteraceae bacterium]